MAKSLFIKENVNPKNKKTGDCVIRAIAKAENKLWAEVFEELVKISREVCSVPNDKDVYNVYLKDYETINVFKIVKEKKKRYTVKDITKFEGSYVVSIAGHMTTVVDGKIFDLWDCGDKCAYKIWKIK